MGETMRRHVAERGRKAMEKEGGVTTDDLKNDMKRLMSLMDTSEEVAEAQKQVRHTARNRRARAAVIWLSMIRGMFFIRNHHDGL